MFKNIGMKIYKVWGQSTAAYKIARSLIFW